MRLKRSLVTMVVVALCSLSTTALGATEPLEGAAAVPVANWEMDEASDASVMIDNSGNGQHGSIGQEVRTHTWTGNGRGFKWPHTSPTAPPAKPERLVTVPDDPSLDPRSGPYSVSFRFRTTANFGNYLQKGQATTPGGQMKVQAPKGRVSCLFKGSLQRSATSSKTPLNDGEWHVVTCLKDDRGVTMYVDGEFRNRNRRDPGYIDNNFPFTIGGKPECDQIKVSCDYFVGQIDWVRIDAG